MPAVVTMPAWKPPIQAQENLVRPAFSKDSSKAVVKTALEQPVMAYDELWEMVEKNMGQPLTQTSLGGR
jgi:hypothetical protein